jgi:hypothetical protein
LDSEVLWEHSLETPRHAQRGADTKHSSIVLPILSLLSLENVRLGFIDVTEQKMSRSMRR